MSGPELSEFLAALTTLFLCVIMPSLIGIGFISVLFAAAFRLLRGK